MTSQAQNTKQNTTDTAETALLSGSTIVSRFNVAAKAYGVAVKFRQDAQEEESSTIMDAVQIATEAFATTKGLKPKDFLPQEVEVDKNGNVTIKAKSGNFGKAVVNKSQANKITAMAHNKTVQAAVKKATPKGSKTNATVILSVFAAKGWTSYKKMRADVSTARIVKLNKLGEALEAILDQAIRTFAETNKLDCSNDDNTATKSRIDKLTNPKTK